MASHGPLSSVHDLRVAIQDLYRKIDEADAGRLTLELPAGEVLHKGMIGFSDENGRWKLASSAAAPTAPRTGYGVMIGSAQAVGVPVRAVTYGRVKGLSGLVPGVLYYLGQGGTLVASDSEPVVVALGRAISTTELLMQPQYISP